MKGESFFNWEQAILKDPKLFGDFKTVQIFLFWARTEAMAEQTGHITIPCVRLWDKTWALILMDYF